MQSLEARSQYRNSFHCAYRIFTEEGVLRFWTGTTPRLVRLVVSRPAISGLTCLPAELLVVIGWDSFHRVRKGDRRYRRSILITTRHCIMLCRFLLWLKPPDLHFIIPLLAHTLSRRPRFYVLTVSASPSTHPSLKNTTRALRAQHYPLSASS